MAEKYLMTKSSEDTAALFGAFDSNIRLIENAFGVRISNRRGGSAGEGDEIVISGEGESLDFAYRTLEYLGRMTGAGEVLDAQTVEYVISLFREGGEDREQSFSEDAICLTNRGKPIKAKTIAQKRYIETIEKNTVILGLGPAGTEKTFLAVAMAVEALRAKTVDRIILTRPAVEAGERLGFLPGDLQSKIDPYLRPLYDALYDMMGAENCMRLIEKMTIEIAPLAYMRGRTLDDSFIILDEAQNTTPEQMKMFLTRLGNGSKIVVTGDLTQTDLPFGQKSGLASAVHILKNIDDIGIHEFSDRDVVRHRLVQKIIVAYDKYDRERAVKKAERQHSQSSYRPKDRNGGKE